ncbi:MAG: hypothetical protein AAF943_14045 [Pseudomonadota bacterium]
MKLLFRIAFALAASFPLTAMAEDAKPALGLELNSIETLDGSCRLTFVLQNSLAEDIDALVAETVLFSEAGQVVLLTLFDFGALPVGKPRVRQFQVPSRPCDGLGQVLVNGVDTCEIAGAADERCQSALSLSSRVRIDMAG